MSPVSLCLNLLLATLLLLTLMLGWRLNRRLKALKDSHAGFAQAVADLDRAAGRAERGLADLRAATDEAVEFLSGRIDKGRELAAKLERLTAVAGASADRAAANLAPQSPAPQSPAPKSPAPHAPPPKASSLGPLYERARTRAANEPIASSPRMPSSRSVEADAESLVLRLSDVLDGPAAPAPAARRPATRSRAVIDDDLFEAPAWSPPRAVGGGR